MPFIVKWGDGTPAGSRITPRATADQMVNIMDVYTTLAEIVGVGVPSTQALDSVSMRDIWMPEGPGIALNATGGVKDAGAAMDCVLVRRISGYAFGSKGRVGGVS